MKKAVIDLGSNSFKLLVAEKSSKGLRKIFEDKVFVHLSAFQDELPKGEKAQPIIDAIKVLVKSALNQGAQQVVLVATSYFRGYGREAWIKNLLVKEGLNYPIHVISGEDEATLIAEGVLAEVPDESFLVMDIGGGSVEFIAVNNRKVSSVRSFDIGVRRWSEKFSSDQGISGLSIEEIKKHLMDEVSSYLSSVKPTLLVGAAGSFETFFSVMEKKYYTTEKASNHLLSVNDLSSHLQLLMHATEEERKSNEFIEDARVKFIPFAALLTDFVIEVTQVKRLKIATNALKEGAFFHYF